MITPHGRSSIIVLALTALAACRESSAEDSRWRGSIETLPNGVEHVRNPAVGMWGNDDGWSIVETLRLGSMDVEGPELFGQILGLEMDALGRIYVLDAHAREVRVFDPDGSHVRSFGKQGGGPGEFEQPAALLWGADGNLWVVDQRNARFAVFDTSGAFVTSHPRPGGFAIVPWPGGIDEQGYLYDLAITPGESGAPPRMGLAKFDRELQPMGSFTIPEYRQATFDLRIGNNFMRRSVPFAPTQAWELSPEGDLWMGITDRYRLHRVNQAGDTLRIVEREFEPVSVSSEDREEAIQSLTGFTEQGGAVDVRQIPSTKPAFRQVSIDSAGYLWVRPNTPGGEDDLLFDLFDPQGRYRGPVRSEFPVSPSAPIVIRGNTILTVTEDELGVTYVVRARIEGRE